MHEELAARFDHYDVQLAADPYGVFERLRAHPGPVRSDAYGGIWVVSRYEHVHAVVHDPETFSSAAAGVALPGDQFDPRQPLVPIEIDPPAHRPLRNLVNPAFGPGAVRGLEADVRRLANDLIDGFIERGAADLVAELALPLPTIVISWFMGVPAEDRPRFRQWTTDLLRVDEPAVARAAARDFSSYCRSLTELRRAEPADDVTGLLVRARIGGEPLSDRQLLGFLIELITAGHETTTSAIGLYLAKLGMDPAQRLNLVRQPSRIASAVEELLRYESPVQVLRRTVTRRTQLAGVHMEPGDTVVVLWGAANRDDAAFEAPEEFDPDRAPNRHLAFGAGIHRCLGSHLARLELRVVLEEVLRRLPDYEVKGPVEYSGGITRSVRSLETTFPPGAVEGAGPPDHVTINTGG